MTTYTMTKADTALRATSVQRLARSGMRVLRAGGRLWTAFYGGGQLGPVDERTLGRHTGARI
jgi:hypothetical protein